MQYQKKNTYDARNAKTASSTSSWVRTSFVLTASIMAVALYQMTSHSSILPENTQVLSNTDVSGGRMFDSDDGLRGNNRRRTKKKTHFHLHLHNEQVQNFETEGRANDKIHHHFKNEPTVVTATTTATTTNLHSAADPARKEDTVHETPETHLNEVAADEVETQYEPSDEHEKKHENAQRVDEVETKQDNNIINDVEEEPNVSVRFTNDFHQPVHVNWMNQATGDEKGVIGTLRPNESRVIESHPGHTFVAFDDERSIRNIFIVPIENKKHEDGSGNGIDQGTMTKVDFRVTMQEDDYRGEPDTSQIREKPASVSKSVAEPEHTHQLEKETEPETEHQHQHQHKDQQQQIEPLVIASFINGYHESIHINWINPMMKEEERVLDNIAPGGSKMLESLQGHTFIAFNEERTFRKVFTVDVSNQDDKTKTFFHIANDQEDNEKVVIEEEHHNHEHEQVSPKQETLVKFVNNFSKEVNVNWIDPQTGYEETVIHDIQPNGDASLQTHSGHHFVAYDKARTFRQVFVMTVKKGYTEIHKIDGSKHMKEL